MSDASTGRRVRKSPAVRRSELADAARAIALEEGLSAVTLRAVAARAGMTPALVAHYAEGMDRLVADTFGEIVAAELAEVVGLLDGTDAAPQRLGRFLDIVLDGSRREVTLVWVQGWGLGARNEALAERVRREMDAWQQAIADEIRRGQDAGVFGEVDADAIAWHLLAMIDGLDAHGLVRWREHPARAELTRRVLAGLLGVDAATLTP